MEKFNYSLEDPIEHRIAFVSQVSMSKTAPKASSVDSRPEQAWNVEGILGTLGSVVGYERESGSMALSSWMGDTHSVWARFDVSPLPPLGHMRQHMVEAVSIDQPRPDGFIRVICFARKPA